jgi:hypothetical protein
MISLLVGLLIFVLVLWAIYLVPIPPDVKFPLKPILYIIVIIISIYYLLRFVQ